VFSDGFLEGQTKDVNGGFPSESEPYTDHYDYLSDSDLEDDYSCSEEENEKLQENVNRSSQERPDDPLYQQTPQTIVSDEPQPSLLSLKTSDTSFDARSTTLPV